MRFWQVKQLPNFGIAMPMVALALAVAWHVLRALLDAVRVQRVAAGGGARAGDELSVQVRVDMRRARAVVPHVDALVYMVHWLGLVAACVLFMHEQVITRFVLACPALYWGAGELLCRHGARSAVGGGALAYVVLYHALGVVLFCNHYPWT